MVSTQTLGGHTPVARCFLGHSDIAEKKGHEESLLLPDTLAFPPAPVSQERHFQEALKAEEIEVTFTWFGCLPSFPHSVETPKGHF